MDVTDAIRARRSIKEFSDRSVDRSTLEELLELAMVAPNHRMTEPCGFVVLGVEARRALGEILGDRRTKAVADADAAVEIRRKAVDSTVGLPAAVAFTQRLHDDPAIREEDYATVYMGMQNVLLGAAAIGLGTHVKSGPAFDCPEAREAFGIPDGDRVVAIVHFGWPADVPELKPRRRAAEVTRWLP